ncbi:AP-4 complex subunit epsilon isoform X1 [Gossypium arboreum]|uniref:AP-4 complex subunit epsilon isoform X1 n=1 Tax=Gossypium arboreum TaxID=29729 RepID=UPI0022F155BE|nr:AP-4 complex subunit epsilon isoform X1 [Gossypium arboreum]XP_052878468.1 AP-4 complex subunit epsilon isoform X1 [Gossypium arboreum]
MGSQGGFYQSKEFLDLVKSIGEARSKAEEDRIVLNEIETLKRRISEPDIPKRKMKEYIIRLVYIEMLGHDASFGYIHAVKMTHDDSLLVKRTGYLAVTLFLNEDHDLIILIVNTIQKDLKSDNYLVVCAALNAVCKLINEETIPAVLPQVMELLAHPKEAVRKKAIMALHRFYQKSPSSVSHLVSNFRKRLCDNDPGVMGATLCPLFELIARDVNSYKDLVISFVSILKQVAERRLSKAYDCHQMPAPFIQIKLLKILALLGSGDKQASENMYTVVGDIFRKCDSSSNIGNAVLYECICCVSSIYPNPKLLESAADVISRFLKSDSHNLKYMGIDALGRLIKISPEIAEQHQLAVIDCLEDPDDTLKRKTFELLYKMTKSTNVEVIVDRMIDYMISISDNHYKTEIASRCVELAEQFAPSNQWFIQTMNRVFEHAGDLVNIKVAHSLMRLIAEGFGEDDDNADSKLRSSAVESYLRILGEPKLPSVFLQVICWVLGEYGTADGMFSASDITGKLCDVAEAYSNDETVKAYATTALMKIYAFEIAARRKVDMLPECQSLMEELLASHSTDLQQRAYELQAVIGLDAHAVDCIMPSDASCEDIEVDRDLSFLNDYIQEAIEKGAQPYIPESERSGMLNISNFRNQDHHEASSHGLRFEAYELPKPAVQSRIPQALIASTEIVPVPEPMYPRESYQTTMPSIPSDAGSAELKLRLEGVQKKWGRPTYTPATSTSNSTSQKTVNGTSQGDGASTVSSMRETYDSRKPQVEVSHEKQKLAASLFGGSSKTEKRPATGHKAAKASSHMVEKSHVPKSSMEVASDKAASAQQPPDLLDLGEPTATSTALQLDPFKQLEGLLDTTEVASAVNGAPAASISPDIMALYVDTAAGIHNKNDADLLSGLSNPSVTNMPGTTAMPQVTQSSSKRPNPKDSLEKDALCRCGFACSWAVDRTIIQAILVFIYYYQIYARDCHINVIQPY